jgi:hypothetical protein
MATLQLAPTSPTILERTLGMPPEGPKCIPFTLDFSVADTYALDYSNMGQRGFMSMLQTVWVDNSGNGLPTLIIIAATGQSIIVPAATQDYFAVMCPNPIKISFQSAGAVAVPVLLLNFPVAPQKNI